MSPLYLQGKTGMQVAYDEPALVVSVPDKARLLFPLPRVSRVIASDHVEWSMNALFACADAGITVIFMTESGAVRSRWLGGERRRPGLLSQLADSLLRPDALSRYQDWFAGMQRMAVRSAARRLDFVDWRLADADSLSAWLDGALSGDWRGAGEVLRGFVLSAVLHYLADFGLNDGDSVVNSGPIRLADDLAALLLWDYYPALVAGQKKAIAAPDRRQLAVLVNQRELRGEQLLRGLLNRLHQCLQEAG